jgi:hypothetical protein
MGFENSAGIDVSNHYGVRTVGGTDGNIKTEGLYNEYVFTIDGDKIDFPFPVLAGVKVVGIKKSEATGTITAITVGGVNVNSATDASPVTVPSGNTGVIVQTGGTAGKIVIKYTRLA